MKKFVQMTCLLISFLLFGKALAQTQPVVVIPVNSNKINKQQTINYSQLFLEFHSGQTATTNNGCLTNNTDAAPGSVPLSLPLGAKIDSIYANIFDDSSATGYTVYLGRSIIESTGLSTNYIASASGGTHSSQVIKENLTPSSQEIVDAGESFFLLFVPGAVKANGFCGAQVTIELP